MTIACQTKECARSPLKFGHCAWCLHDMEPVKRVKIAISTTASGCWEWQGTLRNKNKPNCYGMITVNNKPVPAHRYSYAAFYGEIPKGKFILHKCDNKRCVNPKHLEVGTAQKNTQDAYVRGLIPKGEKYWSAKLTDKQRAKAIALLKNGARQIDVADDFGLAQSSVSLMWCKYKRDHAVNAQGNKVSIAISEGE